jgi:hypothetical protein
MRGRRRARLPWRGEVPTAKRVGTKPAAEPRRRFPMMRLTRRFALPKTSDDSITVQRRRPVFSI